ncbi:MAG TPA: hypothetical protein VGS10_13670 [Terracidiphilus sp.]|nr:hypothetical protein [Terracidiphilus sp.]
MLGPRPWLYSFCALFLCVSIFPVTLAYAKTPGLTAIEIYPGNNGQNVAQIAGFILNGKNQVYSCIGTKPIDKKEYQKLGRVTLETGMSLERNAQGVLMLSNAPQSGCVVPGNLKLNKDDVLSPSSLADRAEVVGNVLAGSDPPASQIPALKPGVLLVFVATPNTELANYLRAQRQGDIGGWKRYLAADAGGSHVPDARKALCVLYQQQADAHLRAWQQSVSKGKLEFTSLKEAKDAADLAAAQVPDDSGVAGLEMKIDAQVLDLSRQAEARLKLYQTALAQQTAGYTNLLQAEILADGAYSVEPSAAQVAAVEQQSKSSRESFDSALRKIETQITTNHPQQAAAGAFPLKAFAPEDARVSSDLKKIASMLVSRARESESASKWAMAVTDLQSAESVSASSAIQTEMAADQQKAIAAANQAAAQAAISNSQNLEQGGDPVAAYEVLDDLPPAQHALVTEQLTALQDEYVKTAEARAKTLRQAHEPINGIADEQGIQQSLEMSVRCYRITNDPDLKDQIDVLKSDLATYYLAQGSKYGNKPEGSGANVAWTYLAEAWQYKSDSNAGQIDDERARLRQAWNIKSSLSIGVQFRDSTSRRDSVDFATQLKEALATGLEQSAENVNVMPASPPVPPNFQLVGDVLEHDLNKRQEVVLKQSKYRSGEQEVQNPKYVEVSKEYDQARDEVEADRGQLQQARTDHKNKEIEAASKQLATDMQAEKVLLDKMGTVPQSNIVAIEEPYTYREIINHMLPKVQLQFRILDSTGNEVVPEVPVSKEIPGEYDQLADVQPTDTEGVHALAGVIPQDSDYFEKCEYAARDLLVKEARAKVAALPQIVLDRADRKVLDGDYDGAAELYILYLNSTPEKQTGERAKAQQFLLTHFNFKDLSLGIPAAQ